MFTKAKEGSIKKKGEDMQVQAFEAFFKDEYQDRWECLWLALKQPVKHCLLVNVFSGSSLPLPDLSLAPLDIHARLQCYRSGG